MASKTKTKKTTSEQDAEALFRGYRDHLIDRLGRGPMAADMIDLIGRTEFKGQWRGVGGQDDFKVPLRPGYHIINSSYTPNSPGYHWVAVYVTEAAHVYTFDSFGRSGASILANLKRRGKAAFRDSDRSDAEQRGASAVCGQLSLAWLLTVRDIGIKKARLV